MDKEKLSCIIKYAQVHGMMSCSFVEVLESFEEDHINDLIEAFIDQF